MYLDNILIYNKDRASYVKHVRVVFKRLRSAELYTKLEKYSFFCTEVPFLGYILGVNKVSIDLERVAIIANWPELITYRDI